VAGAFFAYGLFALDDFGLTWDELSTYQGASANLRFALGEIPFAETIHPIERMPGFYFVANTLRGLIARGIGELFGWGPLPSHHLLGLLISTLCVVLTYTLVLRVSGAVRLAALSAGSLALLPPFLAHSQNNPKDLPAVLCYLACAALLIAVAERGRRRHVVTTAVVFGISVTTRIICVFVAPLMGIWLALRRRAELRRHWVALVLALACAVPVFFLAWPWLWADPLARLAQAAGALTDWGEGHALYLGEIRDPRDMPWHYLVVHLIVSIPLPLLGLAALAPVAARLWRSSDARGADAVWLGLVWVGGLLAADQLSARHYDGLRHFLAILPGVAILVGTGLELVVRRIEEALPGDERQPLRRLACGGAIGVFAAAGLLPAVVMHPYHGAFLNAAANAIGGPRTEEWLEVEYWAGSYREGLAWLEANAEPDADICVPIIGRIAAAQTARRIQPACTSAWFRDNPRPTYLMFITRKAWYGDSLIPEIERGYEPIFEIRRQRATLLRIYASRGPHGRS
jgi:hypothetical protein